MRLAEAQFEARDGFLKKYLFKKVLNSEYE